MAISPLRRQNFPKSLTANPGLVTDIDNPSSHPEDGFSLPWVVDPQLTWLDYRCWVEVNLDAGMTLHKQLPQGAVKIDTLASSMLFTGANIATSKAGVNIVSASQSVDIIQRMATSTYRFRLLGNGLRAAYQIPIPGIISIGGIPAVPERVQRAANMLVGNLLGGIPLFQAFWELHYIIGKCPQAGSKAPVPPNPAAAISANASLPLAVLLPRTPVDQRSTQQRTAPASGPLATFTTR